MTCEQSIKKLEKKMGRKLTPREKKYVEDMMHHVHVELPEDKREEVAIPA